ncbi:von Willebrand factor A domain-containing 7-like [Brachionus plicatilis]|uniref:von Willebrand factor A domain-containing 7-like n=1 Tax=Brachionus plicatilis TaxID=10195 RepID=A0A3M7SEE0_BRAPC|nr:von Willebrand factor A domain-containing 7-like [Brachionus plicatilis]
MNIITYVLISLSFLQYRECFFPNDFPRAFFADLLFSNYDGKNSMSHLEMSKRAIFDFIIETLESMDSSKTADTIKEILDSNEETDLNKDTINNPLFHFDAELLKKTNDRLIKQKDEIISSLKLDEYEEARQNIGQYFHTLQDFYSHSNWVEMNNVDINYDIGVRRLGGKIAQIEEATCVNCEVLTSYDSYYDGMSEWERIVDYEYNCEKNMISDLNEKKILTSGYFSGQILDGEPVSKPGNKCSHGGAFDKTRKIEPYGGINKDGSVKFFSPHYFLHEKAATLATKASKNFLKDIQSEIGIEKSFKNVVFLIDATGSMELDIGAAKLNALRIFTQRSLAISAYQNYVQLSGGSYENNADLIIPELSVNQQFYSVLILRSESFFGQIYIDSFVKNLTIDVKTTGSYSIDDLELENNSQNFLKSGNVYLNFNLSEKFSLNIYGVNDFLISYRFYEYVENSSHPGFRYFDQALSDSEVGVKKLAVTCQNRGVGRLKC